VSEHPEIAARFARETDGHKMTVVHDDGLYRHLRFVGTNDLYWYEIVTTPGQLTFSGDGDSFVFRLAPDMFDMFRQSAEPGGINPVYWAEKCRTGNTKSYSRERFEECVWKQVSEREQCYRALRDDVQQEIFSGERFNVDYEADALMAAIDYRYHLVKSRDDRGNWDSFRFRSVHDWELRDWDWWFLFACFAIGDAIAQYDAAKAPKAVAS
jgi:hypothetical protein